MIYGFYFRFLKYTHNRWISVALSYCARFLFFVRFQVKRLFLKNELVSLDIQEAKRILHEVSPDPQKRPEYRMSIRDETIDLSVIVPVYNQKEMTMRCIRSILDQKTKYSYELILVDDGSTDGVQEELDQFKENYGNVIVIHQRNAGIGGARNTGVENAHGRYIMFVDCDDSIHDDIIEALMNKAVSVNADIAMCAHSLIKIRDGKVVSNLPNINPQLNLLGYKNGDEIMNYEGLPWGKVYRRELWEGVRFFPGYWYEDSIIHALIFPQCKTFSYLPEVKYDYYWHETNFSHVQNNKRRVKTIDSYWILLAIIERYEELSLPRNAMFYTMLLEHVSTYYYTMIAGLPERVVQAMFVVGRELIMKYKPCEKVKLPYMLRLTEKAIINNDIALWKLCSVNQ